MDITYNAFNNVDEVVFYLCNPDRSEIGVIDGRDRVVTLRFNDLSELSFTIDDSCKYYSLIEAKRLVKIDKIGWFQINDVAENDDGVNKYKNVTCESHQTTFRNFGFISEDRMYCFYNSDDVRDDNYRDEETDAVPSIIGQLYKQLGIEVNLDPSGNEFEPTVDYGEWTIIYLSPLLYGSVNEKTGVYRKFEKSSEYAYEFMCNKVSDAYQVVFDFDMLHHAIKIKSIDDISQKTNVYLSFDNLVNSVEVTESSNDIVTVLNCNGDNLDIRTVNPMGTNYIVDFTYYMDEVNHCWMSQDLINALKVWNINYENHKSGFSDKVEEYREVRESIFAYEDEIEYNNLKIVEIKSVQEEYVKWYTETKGGINNSQNKYAHTDTSVFNCGVFEISKGVEVFPNSHFYYGEYFKYDGDIIGQEFNFYKNPPTIITQFDEKYFTFQGQAGSGLMSLEEASSALNFDLSEIDKEGNVTFDEEVENYLYFIEHSADKTYCKLRIKASVDVQTKQVAYSFGGYERFGLSMDAGSCMDNFIARNDFLISKLGNEDSIMSGTLYGTLNSIKEEMDNIMKETSITEYFSDSRNFLDENDNPIYSKSREELYKELKCYWVEGEYSDDYLSTDEKTTITQKISLANELMENGRKELEKICQPKFSFSVNAVNFLNIFKFKDFARELALGKVITIQKSDDTHYYPALTEISINLDSNSDFALMFSNAYKLNDWGFTFADLITNSSNITRKVTSNWSNLTSYSKDKDDLMNLVNDSLDLTLRASNNNLFNQSFVIDKSGILGRQYSDNSLSSFSDKQMRISNNTIIFTDNNWKTAKTALGEITFDIGQSSEPYKAYGLIAEAIIGDLIIGEELRIKNSDDTITIGEGGIEINNGNEIVFNASNTGDVYVKGCIEATSGTIGGCEITNGKLMVQSANIGSISVSKLTAGTNGNLTLDENGNITASNVHISGEINASEGVIGGFNISTDSLLYEHATDASKKVVIGTNGIKIGNETFKVDNSGTLIAKDIQLVLDEDRSIAISADGLKIVGTTSSGFAADCIIGHKGHYTDLYASTTSVMNFGFFNEDDIDHGGMNVANVTDYTAIGIKMSKVVNGVHGATIDIFNKDTHGVINLSAPIISSNVPIGFGSDVSLKNTIVSLKHQDIDGLFDRLNPVSYRYNETPDITRFGFIAQDVEAIVKDFPEFSNPIVYSMTGNGKKYLCYQDFIALNTWQIQKLKTRVESLEREISKLKQRTNPCIFCGDLSS